MSSDDYTKVVFTTTPTRTTTPEMDYPGFPMSIIVTGFFVTSLAYLVCFCCCIIQFFIRRSREMRQNGNNTPAGSQKNDTLKRRFLKQFRNSLRKLQRTATADVKELQMIREMSSLGTTNSCPICFDEYTGDPAEILMGKIKSCGHFYHFDCIWTWLEGRGNCPLCREKVALKEEDIQAIALRHLLHELKNNGRDHTLINMTDPVENNSSGNTSDSRSSDQVAVAVESGVPLSGVVNDGFEDVELSSDTESSKAPSTKQPVEFILGGDDQIQPKDSRETEKIDSNDKVDTEKVTKDTSEVEISQPCQDNTSPKDNLPEHTVVLQA